MALRGFPALEMGTATAPIRRPCQDGSNLLQGRKDRLQRALRWGVEGVDRERETAYIERRLPRPRFPGHVDLRFERASPARRLPFGGG